MEHIKRSLNKGIMQQILDCFVDLAGIRAAYFDENRYEIAGGRKDMCRFCNLIRTYPELLEGCRRSDAAAFKKAEESQSLFLYKCHLGLWEAVVPVSVRRHPAGCLMLGQVRGLEDNEAGWDTMEGLLASSEIPAEKLEYIKEAYFEIEPMDRKKIEAAARMLDIIAQHIIDTEIIHIYDTEAVEKAKSYIGEHYTKGIPIKEIAAVAGLNPSYLSSLFTRETGGTITNYIETLRIKKAKELLVSTNLIIKEIAAITGYDDQNYFSRIFKKREGMSPVEYRQIKKSC